MPCNARTTSQISAGIIVLAIGASLADGRAAVSAPEGLAKPAPAAAAPAPAPPPPPAPAPAWRPDVPGGYASTHIIIKVKPGVSAVTLPNGKQTLRAVGAGGKADASPAAVKAASDADQLLTRWRVASVKTLLDRQPANAAAAVALGLARYHKVIVPAGTDTPAMAAAFARMNTLIESAQVDPIGSVATIPNDPEFGILWGLRNTGQVIGGQAGIAGADISAPEAWDITTGSADIVLAVIDSGVDPHVDLAGKLLPGFNIVDGSTDTSDQCEHGTHVAGIAAALGNNQIGVTGVSWGALVLPVRVFQTCSGLASNAGLGLIWAADHGGRVANLSMQFYVPPTTEQSLGTLHDGVFYARAAGMVLLAAAGNVPTAGVAYPGRFPETIAVAATDNRDHRWQFSSAGAEVDLAAPGVNIESLLNIDQYDLDSGTSMATAYVSGAVCLMLTIDPTLTHDDVQAILQGTADDVEIPGFDTLTGFGRINAQSALVAVRNGLHTAGDLDGNGVVNTLDLGILLAAWSIPPTAPACGGAHPCPADINGDGSVNTIDLGILLSHWTL